MTEKDLNQRPSHRPQSQSSDATTDGHEEDDFNNDEGSEPDERSEPDEGTASDDDDHDSSSDDNRREPSSWITRVAIFGDSPLALFFSMALLLATTGFSWYLQYQDSLSPEEKAYRSLGPLLRPVGPATVFELDAYDETTAVVDQISDHMKNAYQQDGVVAIRGLIPPDLLHSLQEAADQLIKEQHYSNAKQRFKVRGKQFFTVKHSVIFRTPESLQNHTDPVPEMPASSSSSSSALDNPFVRLVVQTSLPQVAATLLYPSSMMDGQVLRGDENNLRLLRDIFLAKDNDPCTQSFCPYKIVNIICGLFSHMFLCGKYCYAH